MAAFYTYELIDPRTGDVFYVGKGKGCRIDQHEKDARAGKPGDRLDVIRSIIADGLSVEKRKVGHYNTSRDALQAEAALIAERGLENLTNVQPGGGRSVIVSRAQDAAFVGEMAKLMRRTEGFAIGTVWIFGLIKTDLEPAFAKLERHLQSVIARRGKEWVDLVSGKYNVRFA